jgi:hypothetical protein
VVSETDGITSAFSDIVEIKDKILKEFGFIITKETRRLGRVFLSGTKDGVKSYCLIKGARHSSATMFFEVNSQGGFRIGCWSSECQIKLKSGYLRSILPIT